MDMSPDHPAWQGLFCKALSGEQEEGEDKGSDGKTTSESGQDWSVESQGAVEDGQRWTQLGARSLVVLR